MDKIDKYSKEELAKYNWYYDKGKFNKVPVKQTYLIESIVGSVLKILYNLIKK